jgi:hypothetical protein
MAPEHAWTFTTALVERWWWPVGVAALASAAALFAGGLALRRVVPAG